MADLPHAITITMLPREFNRSDNYLYSPYFQPMDPADLTYEKMISIVNRLRISFRFGSLLENQFRCLISIPGLRSPSHGEIRLRLLSLLDKKPDITKSRCRPESAGGLGLTSHPTNIRSRHSQDANFAENVAIIETTLSNKSLLELQRQWPQRRLLPRIFYEQFSEAELQQHESVNSDETEL
ncbi:hypothetical protein ACTXT7_001493 [Hymenolepis weldensis]